MPNIPNVPGVPALSSFSIPDISLLTSDAFQAISALTNARFAQWGIYLNGIPMIQPDLPNISIANSAIAVAESLAPLFGIDVPNLIPVAASIATFEYRQDWTVADYPVEQGGFQSYDKVQLPFDIRAKFAVGGPAARRQVFLNTVAAMANSLFLFDVVTPEKVYRSCNVDHFDYRKTAQNGVSLLGVEVWFKQIRVSSPFTLSSTLAATVAGQVGIGAVQPQVPSADISKIFSPSAVT